MRQLLEDIFGEVVADDLRIAIFAMPSKTTRFCASVGEAVEYAQALTAAQDVYFGLGLIRGEPKGRGAAEDVGAIGALWADIDFAGEAHEGKALPANIDEALQIIDRLPIKPSAVIFSGHGLHAYWLLKEPWIFESEGERRRAAALAKGWHARVCAAAGELGWSLENLGGLARVLRPPGTVNHKVPDKPIEVRVLERDAERRYNPEDFEPYVIDEPDREDASVGSLVLRVDAEPPAVKFAHAAATCPQFWKTWERQRPDLADPSQSGYDLSLATTAALMDWSDQEIADLIIATRRVHGQKPEKALRRDYMQRTIALARGGADTRAAAVEGVDISALIDLANPEKRERGFRLTRADRLERRAPSWLLRGALERDTLALCFGDPGSGKTFLGLDWACRIATGTAWRGHAVTAAPVIYVAGEGQNGIARRIEAWQRHHGVSLAGAPLFVSSGPVGMTDPAQLGRLIDAIVEQTDEPAMIALDTLARNFGGGDENSTQDMSAFVAACDALRARWRCCVLIVHHSGHADKSRARGAMALNAALDAEYRVERDGTQLVLSTTKLKDAEAPPPLAMELVTVELPDVLDDYGVASTSAALDILDADTSAIVAQAKAAKPIKRGRWQQLGLGVARRMAAEACGQAVSVQAWRKACEDVGITTRSTISRTLEALIERGQIVLTSCGERFLLR